MAIPRYRKVARPRRALQIARRTLAVLAIPAGLTDPASAQTPQPPTPQPPASAPTPAPAPAAARPLEASPPESPALRVAPRFSEESEIPAGLYPVRTSKPLDPRAVDAFVDGLKGNDATFDVLVNQARILTLKKDIVEGRNQPLIAVGDPTIVDFTIVSPRQIRITGRGIGVTDLSITTGQ